MNPFEMWAEQQDPLLLTILICVIAGYAALLLWGLASYVMRSLSLYTIAKRRGIANYGLAWVPVAYLWTLGSIADQYDGVHGIRRKWRQALLWLAAASVALMILMYVMYFVRVFGAAMAQDYLSEKQILGMVMSIYLWIIPNSVVSMARSVCGWICYYKLFESCNPAKSLLRLLLALLMPFAFPFCLLACRKKDYGMPASEPASQTADALDAAPAHREENVPTNTEAR